MGHKASATAKKEENPVTARMLKALKSGNFKDKQLRLDLQRIKPVELKDVLNKYMQELSTESHKQDPVKQLNKLAESLPLELVEKAVRALPECKDSASALNTAKQMFHDAKNYIEVTENRFTPSVKGTICMILDKIINVIESILNAMGIADFFKPSESVLHADFKFQKIMMLISLFTLLTTTFLPLLGVATGAAIVGAVMLGICVASLIYPLFKRSPSNLPEGENWSELAVKGKLEASLGRENIQQAIAETLLSKKKYPMLIGKTGVGKTEAARSFADAVGRGDYPKLAGKKVFYFNMADLVTSTEMFSGGNVILKRIREAIGNNPENVILIFDEIHIAFQKREKVAIGDQIKRYFDKGPARFPYVIGLTTAEEYWNDIFKNHAAIHRRFKCIPVENTKRKETLKILNNALLHQAPQALVGNKALNYLYAQAAAKFPKGSQPFTALNILYNCINKTEEFQNSELKTKIEKISKNMQFLRSKGGVGQGLSLLPASSSKRIKKLAAFQTELEGLEKQLKIAETHQQELNKTKGALAAIKKQFYQTIMKVHAVEQKNLTSKNKTQLCSFLLQSHFMNPALTTHILEQSKKLGVKAVIDIQLIDEVIKEELATEKKAQAMLKLAQAEMEKRQKTA